MRRTFRGRVWGRRQGWWQWETSQLLETGVSIARWICQGCGWRAPQRVPVNSLHRSVQRCFVQAATCALRERRFNLRTAVGELLQLTQRCNMAGAWCTGAVQASQAVNTTKLASLGLLLKVDHVKFKLLVAYHRLGSVDCWSWFLMMKLLVMILDDETLLFLVGWYCRDASNYHCFLTFWWLFCDFLL